MIGILIGQEAGAQATPDRWATFRHDYQRTGRTSVVGPQQFENLKWKQPVASDVGPDYGVVTSSPAVTADGIVYISGRARNLEGGVSTMLAAFKPDGLLWWREPVGSGQTDSSPSLSSNDNVYIGTGYSSGGTWGVQSRTKSGDFLWWSFLVMDRVLATPALSPDESTIYFGDQSGMFYALNTNNVGSKVWFSDHLTGITNSSPAVGNDGTLYFGSQGDGGRINAIYPSGALRWTFAVEGYVEGSPALSSSGMLYFGTTEGIVYALDTNTVTEATDPAAAFKWVNEDYRGSSFYSSVALGQDDTLYVGNTDGLLCAFDPATGLRKWSFDVVSDGGDGPGAIYSSPAVGGDGTVYFGGDNGILYALDPTQTGDARLKAKVVLDSPLESSPAIGPDGTLFIGAMDGFLYAFGRNMMGDLNSDGEVNVSDVILLLQAIVLNNATPDFLYLGDVSPKNPDGTFGDSQLDVTDAVRILRHLVGFEPAFP